MVLFYTAIIYTSTSLGLCTIVSAVLALLSLTYLVTVRKRIDVKAAAPISVTDAGKAVKLRLVVQSRMKHIIKRGQFIMRIRNCNEKSSILINFRASDITWGDNVFDYEIEFKDAGCYEVFLKKITIYDNFGLIFITRKLAANVMFQILPEPINVGVKLSESVKNFHGSVIAYDDEESNDDTEIKTREYIPGDKVQSIHWKLSAKSDMLMIKEVTEPKACPIVIFLEYNRRKGKSFGDFLRITAGVSFALLDMACPHYIAWYDDEQGDVKRQRVDSLEGYYIFFCKYLKKYNQKNHENVKNLYDYKYRSERYLHGLSINADISIVLGENVIFSGTDQTPDADLGGLEIVF